MQKECFSRENRPPGRAGRPLLFQKGVYYIPHERTGYILNEGVFNRKKTINLW